MNHFDINYFSLIQYLSELVDGSYVNRMEEKDYFYQITEKGERTLSYFLFQISKSTKEKLLNVIHGKYKNQDHSYIDSDFVPVDETHFKAQLRFVENKNPLFEVGLWTANRQSAVKICDNFKNNYEKIYASLIENLLLSQTEYKAVIFDLDGTIINSLADLAASMNNSLKENGYPEHPVEEYRYFVGDGMTELAKRALPEGHRDEDTVRRIEFMHRSQYKKRWHDQSTVYGGINALVDCLKYKKVKICVLTNKPEDFAKDIIDYYFPQKPFDLVLGQREGRNRKPAPDGIIEILDTLSLNTEEVIYVGDSDVDMLTAKNANVFSAGALWGFRTEEELLESGAVCVLKHPLDLLRFFK